MKVDRGDSQHLERLIPLTDPAYCLSAGKQSGGGVFGSGRESQDTFVAHTLTKRMDSSEDGTGRGTPLIGFYHTNRQPEFGNYEEVSPSVKVGSGSGGNPPAIAFAQNQRGELRTSDIAPQLTTGGGKPGEGYSAVCAPTLTHTNDPSRSPQSSEITQQVEAVVRATSPGYIHPRQCRNSQSSNQVGIKPDAEVTDSLTSEGPGAVFQQMQVRRLTPREAERLQGFPDDFTRIPWKNKPHEQCPDGPRYKALGNSMAVNVMRWLGERIQMVEEILQEKVEADEGIQ